MPTAHPPFLCQCLLMSRLVNEKFVVTYIESGKAKNHQVRDTAQERTSRG
jgi:hypothetical protein